jgi:hypothetical protein
VTAAAAPAATLHVPLIVTLAGLAVTLPAVALLFRTFGRDQTLDQTHRAHAALTQRPTQALHRTRPGPSMTGNRTIVTGEPHPMPNLQRRLTLVVSTEPVNRRCHIPRGLSRQIGMNVITRRVLAGMLAGVGIFVGGWAATAPRSFFTSFPFPGHPWIASLPAYDEHLVRDVGDLYLGLAAISVWAVCRPRQETFRLVGTAWIVFSVPHLVFHATHLAPFETVDAAGNVITLAAAVTLALLLLWPQPPSNQTSNDLGNQASNDLGNQTSNETTRR